MLRCVYIEDFFFLVTHLLLAELKLGNNRLSDQMLSPKPHIMTRGNMSGRRRERWLILKNGSCDLDINRLVIIPESTCHLEQEEKKPNKRNGYDKV